MFIQIVDAPALYPTRTLLTLDSRNQPVIDTGVELPDDLGRVYLSFDEVAEIARVAGYVHNDTIQPLLEELAYLRTIKDHLDTIAEETADAVKRAASDAVLRLLTGAVATGGDGGVAVEPAEPEADGTDDGADEAAGVEDGAGVRVPAEG